MIGFIIICFIIIIMVSLKPNYNNNVDEQNTLSPEEIELMELPETNISVDKNIVKEKDQ